MRYRISVVSHIGKVRTVNQDNFYCCNNYRELDQDVVEYHYDDIQDNNWKVAIFDGMGGEKDGEIASLIASKLLNDCTEAGFTIDIDNLIVSMNTEICREMANRKCHMGSTCVFMEYEEGKCRSWNIGDSRAYYFHNGVLTQLSEDHTEAASFSEIFKGESAAKSGSENRLTQHLGIPEDDFIIEPYTSSWETVEPGDIVLICSDGLTHMTDDENITGVLKQQISLQEKKTILLDSALKSGGLDNITIILIEAY